jgi:colanic acid/amylovoran biosynthesis glycosyltransferase
MMDAVNVRENRVVAHCVPVYLPITQTWIYGQLVQMRRYYSCVFTNSVRNVDLFPFGEVYLYRQCGDRQLPALERVFLKLPQYPPTYAQGMRKRGVCLLHAHFGSEGFRLLTIRAVLKVPMVVAFYGYDVSELPRRGALRRWRFWLRLLFLMADRVLAEGPYMRQCLIRLGCPPRKVHVHHLGVDVRKLPFAVRGFPYHGPIRILIAASFREKKGIGYGIEAFGRVASKWNRLELVIVGDGPLRPQIERQIAQLGLGDRVRLMGYQPYERLIAIAQESHIVMAPSVTASNGDTEGGAPVFLIEAQAMGLPVVATRHADIPEVVQDGKTGYLVPERDIDALAERLEYLLDHPDLWPELGTNGRRYVEAKFSLEQQVAKLENIYDDVLRRRKGAIG